MQSLAFPLRVSILGYREREQELEERLRGTNELVMGSKERKQERETKNKRLTVPVQIVMYQLHCFFKMKNKESPFFFVMKLSFQSHNLR